MYIKLYNVLTENCNQFLSLALKYDVYICIDMGQFSRKLHHGYYYINKCVLHGDNEINLHHCIALGRNSSEIA